MTPFRDTNLNLRLVQVRNMLRQPTVPSIPAVVHMVSVSCTKAVDHMRAPDIQ
jgi:hypothetical protein